VFFPCYDFPEVPGRKDDENLAIVGGVDRPIRDGERNVYLNLPDELAALVGRRV
jgi:hypothetical protein